VKARTRLVLAGWLAVGAAVAAMPSAAASRDLTAKQAVHIHLGTLSAIELGDAVHVSGLVSPSMPGAVVSLQQFDPAADRWEFVRSGRLDASSHIDIAVRPTRAGVYIYRVVWEGWSSVRNPSLRVFTWVYLSDVKPTSLPVGYQTGRARIGGQVYSHSVWWRVDSAHPRSSVEWNLHASCEWVTDADTLKGDQATDAAVQYRLSGTDTNSEFQIPTLTNGFNSTDSMIIAGSGLVIAATELASDAVGGRIVFGDLQVHCDGQ